MAHIIRKGRVETMVEYVRTFTWRDDPGSGFSFPCDPTGTVNAAGLSSAGRTNLTSCLNGTFTVLDTGVQERSWCYRHPALLRCDCGREVALDGFTCPCDCGRDYNMSGDLLAPRSQWGEETAESLSDILRIR